MEIEKINDNQLKFILTSDDLIERDINLAELAYGSPKAEKLFREMMEKAIEEYDFQAENNTPLVIEAIPLSQNELMIIVTKSNNSADFHLQLNFMPQTKNLREFKERSIIKEKEDRTPSDEDTVFVYTFKKFDSVCMAASRLAGNFAGNSMLVKLMDKYYLVLSYSNDDEKKMKEKDSSMDLSSFIDSVVCEYGQKNAKSLIAKTYVLEHGEMIISENALEMLKDL